jgi:hypothetical protein
MKKVLAVVVAMTFAGASFGAAHGGKMDDKQMAEKKAACAKADPKMDDKMKAECKAMMEKK